MKIALFGGSFNPIHNGHLEIANELATKKIVDEVWFIPCGNHPFNKKLTSNEDRIKMINLAIKKYSSFKVIGVELNSEKSYTSKTVAWFKKEFSHEFYYILGTDNIPDLNKWHNFEYLKNNIEFIIIKRPNFNIKIDVGIKISYVLDINNGISSTKIRENISNGISIRGFVPKEVEEYIKQGGLYNGKAI